MVVTSEVVTEAVNYFSATPLRSRIAQAVTLMRNNRHVELLHVTPELFDAGLALHQERPDKEWSLTDCISFVVMRQRSIYRALAYDHHFEQAGFEALLRRDPT